MHKSVAEHSDLIPDEHFESIFRKQKSLYMRREMARSLRVFPSVATAFLALFFN
ncbi:hypothetical protein ACKVC7_00965 (plasmid) [Escherichia coli]